MNSTQQEFEELKQAIQDMLQIMKDKFGFREMVLASLLWVLIWLLVEVI